MFFILLFQFSGSFWHSVWEETFTINIKNEAIRNYMFWNNF